MRMYENFSGCRVLSYCVMSNHFHILLEVPPMPAGGISDAVLLQRIEEIQSVDIVRSVADELVDARKQGDAARATAVHARFTYRMHDLSQFMKSLLSGVRALQHFLHFWLGTERTTCGPPGCSRNCGLRTTCSRIAACPNLVISSARGIVVRGTRFVRPHHSKPNEPRIRSSNCGF